MRQRMFILCLLPVTLLMSLPAYATDVVIKEVESPTLEKCEYPDLDPTLIKITYVIGNCKTGKIMRTEVNDLYLGVVWKTQPEKKAVLTEPTPTAWIAGNTMRWCGLIDRSDEQLIKLKMWMGQKKSLTDCDTRPKNSIFSREFVLKRTADGEYELTQVGLLPNKISTEAGKLKDLKSKDRESPAQWLIGKLVPRIKKSTGKRIAFKI